MDDAELLAAWRAGRARAGEQLLARHFQCVRRYFVNKVQDDPEALIQDTFLQCVKDRDRYEGRGSFRCFLLGIAQNLLRQHWRRQGLRGPTTDIDDCSIASLGAGLSTIVGFEQDKQRLLDALRGIPLADQEILELFYWESLTGRELGEVLGLSENGARSRLHRAKIALGEEYRRLERRAGVAESSDESIEDWAVGIRERLRA